MDKIFTVVANDFTNTVWNDSSLTGIFNSYESAYSCVKTDMQKYKDTSYGIDLDFDAMRAEAIDHSFGREWTIIEN